MSLRVLARASAVYTIGNIAPRFGAFILLPLYLRFLTPSEYGQFALLTSLSGVLGLVLTLGLDGALMRLHFDHQGTGRATLYGSLTLFSIGASATVTLLIGVAVAPFFSTLFAGIPFFPLGALTLLIAFAGTIQYVPSVLFRANGQPGYFVAYNLGTFVVASLASVLLIVVLRLGVAGILVGQLVGALLTFGVAIGILMSLGAWSFSRSVLTAALRYGLPLVPHALSNWVLRLSDRWLIALLIGLPVVQVQAAIGVYSFGYQVASVISIIVVSFNFAWSPYFFRIGERPSAPVLYRHVATLVIAGLLAIAVGLSALAPEIVNVVATSRYAQAVDVIRVVAFASVFQGQYTMLVTVIFFRKRTGRLAMLTLGAGITNFLLNILLIPRIGIMGAAWSTLIAYGAWALATTWFALRLYPIRLDATRSIVLASVAVAVVWLAAQVSLPDAPAVQALVHLAIGVTYAAFAVLVAARPLMALRGLTMGLAVDAAHPG
jgi:O-antigen/teichoic acid export membrane protein